ncbi:MAG: methyltransferase, FxLD system [Pseudonocardiaceae bacterium]
MTSPRTTNVDSTQEAAQADALRKELVDKLVAQLVAQDAVRSSEVEAAFRAVPRHLFLPGVSLEAAYANDSIVTKRDEHSVSISSVSAPRIIAMMLEQLQVKSGHRVLEIGSGGYNAALLAELVGEDGEVTTIDIDKEVIDRSRRSLTAAGYESVNVLCADGEFGSKEHAPFDRIVVTVGAWDIAPAWVDQLADGGRIVVPIRMRGLTRSVAFEWEGGHLASRSFELCGFVPMQGAGECRQRLVLLHGDEVGLRVDDGRQVDADLLREALSQPRVEAWSGVTVGEGERFDGLHLWLAMALPGFCLLAAQQEAVDRGIVAHSSPLGIPTAVDGGSFAYLALRPITPERQRFEFGVYGHGPGAGKLANQMTRHIQSWDGSSLSARIEAHPADTPDEQLPEGLVIDKHHTRVTVSWL